MKLSILRLRAVIDISQLSRSTIYLRIQQGLFPAPIKLGPRSIGWPSQEVEALIAARISGQTDDEIRTLVRTLVDDRKAKLAEVLS
jgi:prophage regulatory protein